LAHFEGLWTEAIPVQRNAACAILITKSNPMVLPSENPRRNPMKIEQLQSELDTLVATQAGLMAIVGSLMATHPEYEKFQLHLTGLLEVLLAGEAGTKFTPKQRQQAREFVETLQHLNKAPAKIEPIVIRPKVRKTSPST
jgi:hypothetical protein